jgi:alkaline phosphatase
MKTIILILACCLSLAATARDYRVNQNAHAHNDYRNPLPFYTAYGNRFASIEVDIFLVEGELYVAHERSEIDRNRTLDRLYIQPLLEQLQLNGGKVYPDGGSFQLLVDLKSESDATLRCLEAKLKPLRRHFDAANNPDAVRLVISGNTPAPERFREYDPIFFFDGNPRVHYTREQAARVALYSVSLKRFTAWNGLGRIPEKEYRAITTFVDSLHRDGKKVRFWDNPDTKTLWQAFIKIGVDYLNTDSPHELATFLNRYERQHHAPGESYLPRPLAPSPDATRARNVILLISDGAGFAQLWAAATANRGALNVMNMRDAGFLQTAPFDDYNTDSAAAGTAIATGHKTRNRYIGVDPDGRPLPNLPELLAREGIASGIVSNDNITGATPSAFYAHRSERNMSDSIAFDLLRSPAALVIAGYHPAFEKGDSLLTRAARRAGFVITRGVETLERVPAGKRVICFDRDDPARDYRLIETAFDESVRRLSASPAGFFLMIEGAKIDTGGHANDLSRCIDEYLSFDRVVGRALQFAASNGETLVIVTSDHETGGLVPIDGDYVTGSLLGHFATVDHTGAPVPLFSYGPGAAAFRGFMQNSDLLEKIIQCLK